MYSNFWSHPRPLGYLCVKFRFFRGLHCLEKNRVGLLNHSLTHPAYLMPREPKRLRFEKMFRPQLIRSEVFIDEKFDLFCVLTLMIVIQTTLTLFLVIFLLRISTCLQRKLVTMTKRIVDISVGSVRGWSTLDLVVSQ